jgi:hypothetical protein
VGLLARSPLFHAGMSLRAVEMILAWTVVFGAIALVRFRRDTARA